MPPVLQGLFTNPERNAFRQPGAKQPMYRVRFRQVCKACPALKNTHVLFCYSSSITLQAWCTASSAPLLY